MTRTYRFCRSFLKIIFTTLYSHKVYGAEHLTPGRAIIAPNHTSYLDPPIVGLSCPEEVYFLAKESLFSIPIFSTFFRNLNSFPVSGQASDLKSIKAICSILAQDHKVIIFPEGLRTPDGKLTDLKPGIVLISLRENAPIIPTYIHGAFEIWPQDRWLPKLWGNTVCVFGSPIYPEKFKGLDKKSAQIAMSQEVKAAIEGLKEWYLGGCEGFPP